MVLAARPHIPNNHPMHEYSSYMLDHVDAVYNLVWVLIVFVFFLVVAFTFFGVQKYLERRNLREWRDEVRNLLAVIKGWTVVNKSTADRAVVEIKEELGTMPDKTAARVIDEVRKEGGMGSGTMKRPELPDPLTGLP